MASKAFTTSRSRIRGYKWLGEGRIDPDGAFAWQAGNGAPGPWMRIGGSVPTAIRACHVSGLPYEVNDELWEVELDGRSGHQPFLEQLPYNRLPVFEDHERSVLTMRGRLVRRVGSWTTEVAGEFWHWCASEARKHLLHALRDAGPVVPFGPAAQEPADALARATSRGAGDHSVFTPSEDSSRELIRLEGAQDLIGIWSTATRAALVGPSEAARAFGTAAARMRAAAASSYALLLRGREPMEALQSVAASAYADERTRQAMWLQDRLGLSETEAQGPSAAAGARNS